MPSYNNNALTTWITWLVSNISNAFLQQQSLKKAPADVSSRNYSSSAHAEIVAQAAWSELKASGEARN